jgi:hypothetical protein
LSDYDYPLGTAIWSLTQERVSAISNAVPVGLVSDQRLLQVAKLRKERDSKEEEPEAFTKVTPPSIMGQRVPGSLAGTSGR